MFDIKFKEDKSYILYFLSFIFILFFFYHQNILETVNNISLGGYSQLEVTNSLSGEVASNSYAFVSTSIAKKSSIITWIYYVLSKFFNISGLNLIIFFKFLEFLIIPFSTKYFFDSLKVNYSFKKSIIYLAIPVLSTVGYNNWANYGQIFIGEWYQFPHYLFFLTLGLILRKKLIYSLFILLLIFLIHPAKGFALIVVISPIFLQSIYRFRKEINLKKHYLTLFLVSLIAGIFTIIILPSKATLMDTNLWIAVTKVHNFHILQSTLNFNFIIYSFLPIFVLSLGIYFRLKNTEIKFLSISLFLISTAGIVYDFLGSNPTILKLILHRTSENIILLSILLIISQVEKLDYRFEFLEIIAFYFLINKLNILEINNKIIFFGLIYCLILYLYKNNNILTLPLTYFLLLFEENLFKSDILFVFVFAFLILTFKNNRINQYLYLEFMGPFLIIFYIITKFDKLADLHLYNINFLFFYIVIFIFAIFINNKLSFKNLILILLFGNLGIILFFINFSSSSLSYINNVNNIISQRTNGYYEAQVWSKNNTSVNSIFFPDPKISYAWRDFSNRNSFGTPREFVTSWLYTQDKIIFDDSINRLGVFVEDPLLTMLELNKSDYLNKITEIYYNSDYSLYKSLSEDWQVDYFLWRKEFNLLPYFTIVYETDSHYILILN